MSDGWDYFPPYIPKEPLVANFPGHDRDRDWKLPLARLTNPLRSPAERARGVCWVDQEGDALPADPADLEGTPCPLSAGERARLAEVAAGYPHREWTDSERQWERLRFLRWRVWTGRCSDE